jgi:hypothetical protein
MLNEMQSKFKTQRGKAVKNLLYILAISLWVFIIVQACQIQYTDEQALDMLTLEQQLKLDAERLQAVDSTAAQIMLDTLQNVQAVQQEIVLDDINIY